MANKIEGQCRRRASFGSAQMAMNLYPESVNFRDMVINVLMGFDNINGHPSEEELVPIVKKLLGYHHRMNSIPTGKVGEKNWTFEPVQTPTDPKALIRTIHIDCDNMHDMTDVIQHESSRSLRSAERNLPWWEFVVLSNKGKGGSVIMMRIDHTIGDGFSVGKICSTFITQKDASQMKDIMPKSMKTGKDRMFRQDSYLILIWKFIYGIIFASVLQHFMGVDHKTAFSKNVVGPQVVDTGKRKMFIFDPIPLDFVKALKNAAKCTLNDVLMSCLSQAIHDYCKHQDCATLKKYGEDTLCRCAMAFGFPSDEIQNSWVPITVNLGLGKQTPRRRLQYIREVTTNLKQSFIPHCQKILIKYVLPYLPVFGYKWLAYMFTSNHTMAFSCVPGPSEEVFIAGKPVSRCWFTVRSIHPVFLLLSYNGEINMTMVADDEAIDDLDLIPTLYMRALSQLADDYGVAVPEKVKDSAYRKL